MLPFNKSKLPIWTVTNIFPIYSLAIVMSVSGPEYLLRWWCSRGTVQMVLTSQQVIIGSWHPTQSNNPLTPKI